MRFKRHIFPAAILAVVALALVIGPEALAQNFGLGTAVKGTGIPKTTEIATIIARILGMALLFVGTLFLLLMVYAGFLWMTARGDSKKVDQAKQLITGAIIGVIIISSAYAITAWVLTAATGTNLVTSGEESSGEETGADETKKAAGEACQNSGECQSDVCAPDFGLCSNDDEVTCLDDDECSGGTCEGASQVCE